MSFQVGIGSLGGAVFFSGETLYPSANYGRKGGWAPYQIVKKGAWQDLDF